MINYEECEVGDYLKFTTSGNVYKITRKRSMLYTKRGYARTLVCDLVIRGANSPSHITSLGSGYATVEEQFTDPNLVHLPNEHRILQKLLGGQ
jgi:hypothetical protein